jgi:hypothetical protein
MHPRKSFLNLFSLTLLALLLTPVVAPAGQKPKEWNPVIEPSSFVSFVDNPYFPLTPGTTYEYADKTGTETLVIEVTGRTKTIMGVRTIVVIETGAENGQTVEISENWYAQDRDGNVWYFGEFTQDFVDGAPAGTGGSWEAGVNGAQPGIIMKAQPQPGDTYFQEHAPGVAEDMATVQQVGLVASTALRTFPSVIKTKEWNPLESGSVEFKYYASGIGLIREEKSGKGLELVAMD